MVPMGTLCTMFHLHVLNCVCWFEKLKGSHGLKPFFVNDRHGNTEIHMRTKFYLHELYGVQV